MANKNKNKVVVTFEISEESYSNLDNAARFARVITPGVNVTADEIIDILAKDADTMKNFAKAIVDVKRIAQNIKGN